MSIGTRVATGIGMMLALLAAPAEARPVKRQPVIEQRWLEAHEAFLAGDALRGRGSATHDEAVAAAYVASQFQGFGLTTAPGMPSYLQVATIVRYKASGGVLKVGGATQPGLVLHSAMPDGMRGTLRVYSGKDPAALPAADAVVVTATGVSPFLFARAAQEKKVKLLIVAEDAETRFLYQRIGSATSVPAQLEGTTPPVRTALATLPAATVADLATRDGAAVSLDLLDLKRETATTTNAVAYLPGTDPKAGVVLLSAHLDHLGVRGDGTVMHGANDDASGTAAVLELARTLAAGAPTRRGILFVAYGAEEIGGYGSRFFAAHSPVSLERIVANVEFEMIGVHDPKFTGGALMMTGFERSTLGPALLRHGARLMRDPYPDQHFFDRSDNYQLALAGVVAHTVSGWAVTPTYHKPTDLIAAIDFPFMTRAVQSLVTPMRWLADTRVVPRWNAGGRPTR